MMLTPSVMGPPETEAELPFWGTEGNDAGKKDVLGTTNERDLKIITNDEPRMVVTSEGKVGIGIAEPQYMLDVNGDVHISGQLYVNSGIGPSLEVTPTGVGIGTTSPIEALDVVGNIHASEKVLASAYASNSPLIFEAPAGTERARIDDVTGNFGIGTTNPEAKLDVEIGAFEGGVATIGSSLNTATGDYGIAMGYDTHANGRYSTAMGVQTTADGWYSTAMGFGTNAIGWESTAMGHQTKAWEDYSTAMGEQTEAVGISSTAMGRRTTASGYISTAMGDWTTASGDYSTSMGYETIASGDYSTAMGSQITAEGEFSFGIGLDYEWLDWTITQANAMAIMGGNVGIGTTSPSGRLEVVGDIIVSGTVDGVDIDVEVDTLHTTDVDLQNQIDNLQGQIDSKVVKQLIQDFVVASGESVTAGDVVSYFNGYVQKWEKDDAINYGSHYMFDSISTYDISAAALSSTQFVVAYMDWDNSYYGTAIIGDVLGNTIVFGSEYVFNSQYTSWISAAALSPTKFVVAYDDLSCLGAAVIGDVTGNTIEFGFYYVFNDASDTQDISVTSLTSDKFVVAYSDAGNSGYGTAVVGVVTGNVITFGLEYEFPETGTPTSISADALSSTKFVVTYDHWACWGGAVIGDVSGDTITFGEEYEFNYVGYTSYISVASLSSNKFVVAYQDGSNSYYGTAQIGDVSDNVITFGSEYIFKSGYSTWISASALSSMRFIVAFREETEPYYGRSIVGYVSGDIITFGSEYAFDNDFNEMISVVTLSPTIFAVAYSGPPCGGPGYAVIGEVHPGAPVGSQIVGIAKESKAADETVQVIIDGVSDVHLGLTPGAVYYVDDFGSLTMIETDHKIGMAISSTEMILADPFF
jgi:hypothetical protein